MGSRSVTFKRIFDSCGNVKDTSKTVDHSDITKVEQFSADMSAVHSKTEGTLFVSNEDASNLEVNILNG